MPVLFSYGSLQRPEVQISTFGRLLVGSPDMLPGYTTTTVSSNRGELANATQMAGSAVAGTAFEVTEQELVCADGYEAPDGYARVAVTLRSGCRAWVYTFTSIAVRAARQEDLIALAHVWFEGWHDAHDSIVPATLVAERTLEKFRDRLHAELHAVRVVVDGDTPLALAMLRDTEVFQFYVARSARGTGVAASLMRDTEEQMRGKGIANAWLACAVGNMRAARFYEKCGWRRIATEVIESETSIGRFPVDVWRYEKRLR